MNIEGCTDDNEIVTKFAVHFKNVFCKLFDDTTLQHVVIIYENALNVF